MLLDNINSPAELKALSVEELPAFCAEVRDFLLQSVSDSGGHLASGLGVLELTVALHYVYDTPNDRLIWDVGHQAYVHKLLTGRRSELGTIKKKDGLCGFPRREESKYDDFGVGHTGLDYLDRIEVDTLKIDRSFINRIGESGAPLVTAVISLAKGLNLDVIAEGVETRAQVNFLKSHGCRYMQGFLFSKPLTGAQLEQVLRNQVRRGEESAA